jgi:hypothetical protein
MELRELNPDERTALVGLTKVVVMSDADVSEDEIGHVEKLVDAFGEEDYERTLDTFEKRFPDVESFKKFLRGIGRQDARDLIFSTVLDSAQEDGLEDAETELLDWLSATWNIKIEIEDGTI